jgi:hypothetical protein
MSNSRHRQNCVTAIEPSDYDDAGILVQPVPFLWIFLESQTKEVAWIFDVRWNGSKTLFEAMFGFRFDETVNVGEWVDKLM